MNLYEQYNKYLQKANMSAKQQNILSNLIAKLSEYIKDLAEIKSFIFKIEEDFEENEIILTKFENEDISYVTIDENGDVMISIMNNNTDKPIFIDNNQIDIEHIALSILQ